mgnify:CR=1 FL=1
MSLTSGGSRPRYRRSDPDTSVNCSAGGGPDCHNGEVAPGDGQLTVATGETVFPPWMGAGEDDFDDPSTGTGYEGALVFALADRLGVENVEFVRTGFDEVIAPGEKDWDFNIQQYSITPDRDEVVDFSMPYYTASKSVLALNSSPAATATDFAGLADATWGATIGTTDLDYLENEIGADDVAVFDTQSDVVAAMLAGQIDATVVTLPTAFFLNAVELDDSTIVGVLPAIGANDVSDDMALLFTDGNPLVDCVDRALTSLADSGELDAIAEEWLQGANDIPNITK